MGAFVVESVSGQKRVALVMNDTGFLQCGSRAEMPVDMILKVLAWW